MMNIFNNLEDRIKDWIYEYSEDIQQIHNRSMIIAGSPVFIGATIGIILVLIIEMVVV